VWQGASLVLTAALGHAADPQRPLLRTQVSAVLADEPAARRLGEAAAAELRVKGAGDYLVAS
jgi:hydroxymethylbilane synthase